MLLIRDAEERKKERSKHGQKMSCLGWDSTTTELPRQFSWLGPNLTSHSTPDEQANHQLSMKVKAGVMKPPKTPNTKPSIIIHVVNER